MPRSLLRPLRTRRALVSSAAPVSHRRAAPWPVTAKTRQPLAAVDVLWLAFAASPAHAAPPAVTTAQPAAARLVRGRYLVEPIGLCADCHPPGNEKGEFIRELWLKSATLPFQPTVPMPWSPAAPPLAGLPSMTAAQAGVFMQTGSARMARRRVRPCPSFVATPPTPAPASRI